MNEIEILARYNYLLENVLLIDDLLEHDKIHVEGVELKTFKAGSLAKLLMGSTKLKDNYIFQQIEKIKQVLDIAHNEEYREAQDQIPLQTKHEMVGHFIEIASRSINHSESRNLGEYRRVNIQAIEQISGPRK